MLEEKYLNVQLFKVDWLNKGNNVGEGCDFLIRKNGAVAEYIEVKSKTTENEEFILITGRQWEFARSLFDRGEGEKYCIYLVSNAGTARANIRCIRNPVQLWQEGKLYAHPIKFKL